MSKKTVRIVLQIDSDDSGSLVVTSLRPLSQEDSKVLSSWETGGLAQVSYALMIEYLKAEAYVMAISMLSRGKELPSILSKDLSDNVLNHFLHDSKDLVGKVCQGILDSLRAS